MRNLIKALLFEKDYFEMDRNIEIQDFPRVSIFSKDENFVVNAESLGETEGVYLDEFSISLGTA